MENVACNCGRRKRDPRIGSCWQINIPARKQYITTEWCTITTYCPELLMWPHPSIKKPASTTCHAPRVVKETEYLVNSTNDYQRHGAELAPFELTIIPKMELRHQP